MSKSLYEVGRAGLHQFIDALGEIIDKDVELTFRQAGQVPIAMLQAEQKLLAAWDEICGIRPQGGSGDR